MRGRGRCWMAAAAWEGLAVELSSAAASFRSVIIGSSECVRGQGPASLAMADVAAPYVGWLSAVGGARQRTRPLQAQAAATAFEAARTATVHPAAVAANRMPVDVVGGDRTSWVQNAPAIAATEFQYVEMWAQDLAAMVGYHAGAVSVASMLTPFRMPPKSLAGLATRASRLATRPRHRTRRRSLRRRRRCRRRCSLCCWR